MDIAQRSTAIGVFPSRAEATEAIQDLLAEGFAAEQVGLVLSAAAASTAAAPEHPVALLAGEMFRALVGAQIPEAEVRYYEEVLEEGRPLVMVQAGDRFAEASDILYRNGGEFMAAF